MPLGGKIIFQKPIDLSHEYRVIIYVTQKQIALYNLNSVKRKSRDKKFPYRELSVLQDSERLISKIISEKGKLKESHHVSFHGGFPL